jgi:hypothetical protein
MPPGFGFAMFSLQSFFLTPFGLEPLVGLCAFLLRPWLLLGL